MKGCAAIHESFHENFLLDRFTAVDGINLLLFFDKLSIIQVNMGAHLNKCLHSSKVTFLDCREKWCLAIIIDHVDFGSESSLFTSLRFR